jgi:geranylgeranyl pyrophosphate synthase
MEKKSDQSERFDLYLRKTYNKTASLIAHTCQANAILAAEAGKGKRYDYYINLHIMEYSYTFMCLL